MDRRIFIKNTGFIGSGIILSGSSSLNILNQQQPSLQPNEAFRWDQLVFVENDPGHYDPEMWLSYFKRIHAQGALLSAGGVVAFYPTKIPLHHRSQWMPARAGMDGGDSDPLGY